MKIFKKILGTQTGSGYVFAMVATAGLSYYMYNSVLRNHIAYKSSEQLDAHLEIKFIKQRLMTFLSMKSVCEESLVGMRPAAGSDLKFISQGNEYEINYSKDSATRSVDIKSVKLFAGNHSASANHGYYQDGRVEVEISYEDKQELLEIPINYLVDNSGRVKRCLGLKSPAIDAAFITVVQNANKEICEDSLQGTYDPNLKHCSWVKYNTVYHYYYED